MHAVGSVCELVKHCCHQNVGSCHGILTVPDVEPYDLNHSVVRLHLLHVPGEPGPKGYDGRDGHAGPPGRGFTYCHYLTTA